MKDLATAQNAPEKVEFRERILTAQEYMLAAIAKGEAESVADDCTLKHYFTPIDPKYGCCAYARQIFLPKDSLVIGKIHKHQHLNFILRGKVSVSTEHGKKTYDAPCVFVSEIGLKRMVFAEEDTIWVTVHLTEHRGEENLDKIEDEVIAKSYAQLGLAASMQELLEDSK